MRTTLLLLILAFFIKNTNAQDDIELNLDSIKNIKTTRYSSINEIGININIAGKVINKFPGNTLKTKLPTEKPDVIFRSIHGVLLNPHHFIGAGIGIDFRPNSTNGSRFYYFTFPIFAEFRQYILSGNFNLFFSERLGGAFFIDTYTSKYNYKGTTSGAFGEFMIGGRYVTQGKKIAIHFGLGYRLQHLQRKVDFQSTSSGITQTYTNMPEVTVKHYIPITIGITF